MTVFKSLSHSFSSALARSLMAIGLAAGVLGMPALANAEGPIVRFETSAGDIVLQLDEERAPITVANFMEYVDDGFYAGTLFHRVIDGFMIQGGGFTADYMRKQTRGTISNEAYNGLRNEAYTISMARRTQAHSATSQFFINSVDNRNLDHTSASATGWGYAVFGHVIEGAQVVDQISQTPTGPGGPFGRDVPRTPIVIKAAVRVSSESTAAAENTVTDETVLQKTPSE